MKHQIKEILSFLDKREIKYIFKGNHEETLKGYSSLFNYKVNSMTFIAPMYSFKEIQEQYKDMMIKLIIIGEQEEKNQMFENTIQLKEPKKIFFMIIEELFLKEINERQRSITTNSSGNNQDSIISPNAVIGKNVSIGKGCVIESEVTIGDNTQIHHNVVIRSNTRIGSDCKIYSGTVIGESGFNPFKNEDNTRTMLKHYGGVTIKNNVLIGANCNIHKGSIDDTVLEQGVKVNSMAHIAHNCEIGENTVITVPTYICGSVKIGKECHIAAVTIRNQCTVGDKATLGLGAVVVKDVDKGATVVGNPAKKLKR